MPTKVDRLFRAGLSTAMVAALALPATALLDHEARSAVTHEEAAARSRPRLAAHPRILVIAHRGFSAIAPENTLPAMTAAAKVHADMVEFDVQRTRDGQLIVVHDATFARTTDVARVFPGRANDPVGSFTLAEVKRLDAGSWKGVRFAGTRVPTLDELLATMRPTSTNLLLELKNPSLYPGYETQVASALAAYGFTQAGRVYVHSYSLRSLAAFHRAAPSVPLGLITMSPVNPEGVDTWLRTLNPVTSTVNDASIDQAYEVNLQVFAWPLDLAQASSSQVERMVDDGVSGIITDNPLSVEHLLARSGDAAGAGRRASLSR